MIDRKALWLSIAIIFALTAALVWRLSLLPDWHRMPLDGPGGGQTVDGLRLFMLPATMALVTAAFYARKWLTAGSDDAIRPWRRWSNIFVVANCVMAGLLCGVMIARSLGYGLGMDRPTIGHGVMTVMGILVMAMGNALPKMPWLSARFRWFQLDPWQHNRQLRFVGKLLVGMGLYVAIGSWLLPPQTGAYVMHGLTLAMMAAVLWHRAKLKREPSPLA